MRLGGLATCCCGGHGGRQRGGAVGRVATSPQARRLFVEQRQVFVQPPDVQVNHVIALRGLRQLRAAQTASAARQRSKPCSFRAEARANDAETRALSREKPRQRTLVVACSQMSAASASILAASAAAASARTLRCAAVSCGCAASAAAEATRAANMASMPACNAACTRAQRFSRAAARCRLRFSRRAARAAALPAAAPHPRPLHPSCGWSRTLPAASWAARASLRGGAPVSAETSKRETRFLYAAADRGPARPQRRGAAAIGYALSTHSSRMDAIGACGARQARRQTQRAKPPAAARPRGAKPAACASYAMIERAAPRRPAGRACGGALGSRQRSRRRRRSPRFAGTTPQSTEPPHAIMATMRYTTQNVPYGPLAAALARGVAVTAAPDAALPRDAQPTLALASGCAPLRNTAFAPFLSAARAPGGAALRATRGGAGQTPCSAQALTAPRVPSPQGGDRGRHGGAAAFGARGRGR